MLRSMPSRDGSDGVDLARHHRGVGEQFDAFDPGLERRYLSVPDFELDSRYCGFGRAVALKLQYSRSSASSLSSAATSARSAASKRASSAARAEASSPRGEASATSGSETSSRRRSIRITNYFAAGVGQARERHAVICQRPSFHSQMSV